MNIKATVLSIVIAIGVVACGGNDNESEVIDVPQQSLDCILSDSRTANQWDIVNIAAPDDGCQRLELEWKGPLKKEFNDSNHVHLEAARALGFSPIESSKEILNLQRPVVRIESCPDFYVDPPTHSFTYLVPEAADLLHEIGRRFNKTLQERGGGAYRIKVSSLLRTPATVSRLRRVNRNATSESTHSYGTTFDISYSKFICDDPRETHRTFEDLKNLLGEVLHDLRNEGRCYVKYEVKQSCFHITARPSQ